jgi:WD40 repeat protein
VAFVRSSIYGGWVMSVKFSTDGRYLAAALGGNSGSVVIFDVETGEKIWSVATHWIQFQLSLNSK